MNYKNLGNTDIKVSTICLGTMTWGEQNTELEAFEQMDFALDLGVNFWDTAELYAVPPRKETYGDTEEIIGNWFEKTKKRDKVVLATKVAGPARDYLRSGENSFTGPNLESALNDSLKRLKTDYIDLYQLHWPDRHTNFLGQLGYQPKPDDPESAPIAETLKHLSTLVQAGKIRHIGLSNETPWGTMKFLALAEQHGLERVVSIQNPYNLLNRTFEIGLAEIAHREQVGLLAYSPLAFGVLSGKYRQGARPPKARLTLYERFSRYNSLAAQTATEAYVDLAETFELSPRKWHYLM